MMRKHNRKMQERFPGSPTLAHQLANSKPFQLAANSLLRNLVSRVAQRAVKPAKPSFMQRVREFGRSFKAEVLA